MVLILRDYLKPIDYLEYYDSANHSWDIIKLNKKGLNFYAFKWEYSEGSAIEMANAYYLLEKMPSHCKANIEENAGRTVYFIHDHETIENLKAFLREYKILDKTKYNEVRQKCIEKFLDNFIHEITSHLLTVLNECLDEDCSFCSKKEIYEELIKRLKTQYIYKGEKIQNAQLEITKTSHEDDNIVYFAVHTNDEILSEETCDKIEKLINEVLEVKKY